MNCCWATRSSKPAPLLRSSLARSPECWSRADMAPRLIAGLIVLGGACRLDCEPGDPGHGPSRAAHPVAVEPVRSNRAGPSRGRPRANPASLDAGDFLVLARRGSLPVAISRPCPLFAWRRGGGRHVVLDRVHDRDRARLAAVQPHPRRPHQRPHRAVGSARHRPVLDRFVAGEPEPHPPAAPLRDSGHFCARRRIGAFSPTSSAFLCRAASLSCRSMCCCRQQAHAPSAPALSLPTISSMPPRWSSRRSLRSRSSPPGSASPACFC